MPLGRIATCADGRVERGSYKWRHSKIEERLAEWRDVLQLVETSGTKFIFVLENRKELDLWMAAIKAQMALAKSPTPFDARKLEIGDGADNARESIKRGRKLVEEIVLFPVLPSLLLF